MNNDDFMLFFKNITSGQTQNSNPKSDIQSMTEELDCLWSDYQDYLSSVKENYKVMRNENGKHRLEKN